mmetsp:Transcript_70185/g.218147  ORF Transcript_70185/g.218147 Transcript_70185/m.218147 type:complete len:204 (-) Transcript_70185:81-692(-)
MEAAARPAAASMRSSAGPRRSALAQAQAASARKDSSCARRRPVRRSRKATPVRASKLPPWNASLDISVVAMAQETIVKSCMTKSPAGTLAKRSVTAGKSIPASSLRAARATDQTTQTSTRGRQSAAFARATLAAALAVARTGAGSSACLCKGCCSGAKTFATAQAMPAARWLSMPARRPSRLASSLTASTCRRTSGLRASARA